MHRKLIIVTESDLKQTVENAVNSVVSNGLVAEPTTHEVLTVRQAAKLLGLSPSTIYSHISRRTIPFVKRNGSVWLLRSRLIDWLSQGERKTFNEIKNESKTL